MLKQTIASGTYCSVFLFSVRVIVANLGNNALAKHCFAMELQCLFGAFRKETDDVI